MFTFARLARTPTASPGALFTTGADTRVPGIAQAEADEVQKLQPDHQLGADRRLLRAVLLRCTRSVGGPIRTYCPAVRKARSTTPPRRRARPRPGSRAGALRLLPPVLPAGRATADEVPDGPPHHLRCAGRQCPAGFGQLGGREDAERYLVELQAGQRRAVEEQAAHPGAVQVLGAREEVQQPRAGVQVVAQRARDSALSQLSRPKPSGSRRGRSSPHPTASPAHRPSAARVPVLPPYRPTKIVRPRSSGVLDE